jgi:hypothetical protein
MAVKSTGRFTPELRGLMRESYDQCRSCGSKLPKEIAAFAGYDKVGAPLYVGECCKHHIDELAIRRARSSETVKAERQLNALSP